MSQLTESERLQKGDVAFYTKYFIVFLRVM